MKSEELYYYPGMPAYWKDSAHKSVAKRIEEYLEFWKIKTSGEKLGDLDFIGLGEERSEDRRGWHQESPEMLIRTEHGFKCSFYNWCWGLGMERWRLIFEKNTLLIYMQRGPGGIQLETHPGDGIWMLEWWGRCQSNGQLRPEEKGLWNKHCLWAYLTN